MAEPGNGRVGIPDEMAERHCLADRSDSVACCKPSNCCSSLHDGRTYHTHTHKDISNVNKDKPLPSNRQYLSCDACLEVKREDNQNCSVLCCVRQLCTVICTQMWAILTVLWIIGFYHAGLFSLCVDLCLSACICFLLHRCNSIVSKVGWTFWY